jgi:DNA-binding transcriptional regulator WhiA
MFEDPDEIRHESRDPNDARAVAIMRQHPNMSLRELARLLASNGIRRGKDWVRQHRCD